jgi:hypothetical protein
MTQLLGSFGVAALSRRAFWRGAASAFDLSGNTMRQYRFVASETVADQQAIRSDWEAVGADMRTALDQAAEQRLAAR